MYGSSLCKSFFWTASWLLALGASAGLLLRWWPGERLTLVRLTIYLLPWLLVLLLPALLGVVLAQRRWLALLLALNVGMICFAYAPLFLPRVAPVLAGGDRLTVMSYNVWSENPAMSRAAALIRREAPEVLLLQEIKPHQLEDLLAEIDQQAQDGVKLNVVYEPELLQAVLSPHPLHPLGAFARKGQAQSVRVETPRGPVTVFNIHPLRGNWLRRHDKIADLLREDVLTTEGPVILGGDFNTTDQIRTYRMVARHLRNSHWEAGRGFGFTFPADGYRLRGRWPVPPLVRIDHIFYSGHWAAVGSRTLTDGGGSDHRPVVAELAWKEPPPEGRKP